jgi:hypothetical protein
MNNAESQKGRIEAMTKLYPFARFSTYELTDEFGIAAYIPHLKTRWLTGVSQREITGFMKRLEKIRPKQ